MNVTMECYDRETLTLGELISAAPVGYSIVRYALKSFDDIDAHNYISENFGMLSTAGTAFTIGNTIIHGQMLTYECTNGFLFNIIIVVIRVGSYISDILEDDAEEVAGAY